MLLVFAASYLDLLLSFFLVFLRFSDLNSLTYLQVEHALAEQFQSVYKDGSFVTTPVSHSGG